MAILVIDKVALMYRDGFLMAGRNGRQRPPMWIPKPTADSDMAIV